MLAKKLGIIGGGQLARMMAMRAHELGVECWIFSADRKDPAAQVCANWVQGNLKDASSILSFLDQVDYLTFESEFVDGEVLDALKEKKDIKTCPSTWMMKTIQDRLTQKELLKKYQVETALFSAASSVEEVMMFKQKTGACVIKARKDGYDGHGTFVLKSDDQKEELEKFMASYDCGFIVEKYIPFNRELAVTFVRGQNSHVARLPLVETFQEDNRCLWVKGPIDDSQYQTVFETIENLLHRENYVGAITFEFFEIHHELIVNEIAPRVHNSAHYSQNALTEDQFCLHVRAVIGGPLFQPKTLAKGFAMYNLIGKGNEVTLKPAPETWLHWYGKSENRPGRKMGHINGLGDSPEDALEKVTKAREGMTL